MAVPPRRPWHALALLIALAILAAGCGSVFPELNPPATGRMAIAATLAAPPGAPGLELPAPYEIEVTLTQDRQQVQERRPMHGDTATITIDNLYIGRWQVEVVVRDAAGDAIYSGSGSVWINENETTTVSVPLAPRPGTFDLTIDIAGLTLEHQSYKARLHVGGSTYNLDRLEGTAQFQARVSLSPGSYDFKVDFYTDSFHAYKLIYSGYWMPVAVLPGKTTALYWKPGTGAVVLETGPAGPPPAPAGLSATWQDGSVLLEWTAVTHPDVIGYRLYRRLGALARYELLAEVGPDTTAAVDMPPVLDGESETGTGVYYVVTSVNKHGYESLRSPEAVVLVPRESV